MTWSSIEFLLVVLERGVYQRPLTVSVSGLADQAFSDTAWGRAEGQPCIKPFVQRQAMRPRRLACSIRSSRRECSRPNLSALHHCTCVAGPLHVCCGPVDSCLGAIGGPVAGR